MSKLRPNGNVSMALERLYGVGLGIFLGAMLAVWPNDSTRALVVSFGGLGIVFVTIVGSILVKRRQIATARANNVETLRSGK
ncbi:MAG TPA: hypothetical protein VGE30_03520 [Candidatus Saccharimonadales bacterium]